MNSVAIKTIKTWSLTWDRPNRAGKRTGNHFFSERRAKEIYEHKKSAGLNPSEIEVADKDWLCI